MRFRFLSILILILSAAAFAKEHTFQAGRLIDVSVDDRLGAAQTRRSALLVVDIGDIEYTLNAGRIGPHGKDYAHGLVVGDPVQASVEGENVFLLLPKGKDLKTSIIKRSRLTSH